MQHLEVLARGVSRAPFTVAGKRVLIAVDSAGDIVGWFGYHDTKSKQAAKVALWAMLDLADPLPVRLVV